MSLTVSYVFVVDTTPTMSSLLLFCEGCTSYLGISVHPLGSSLSTVPAMSLVLFLKAAQNSWASATKD